MVRVRFETLRTDATNTDGVWTRCDVPHLLVCLRDQGSVILAERNGHDVELECARRAIATWGGHVVAVSWPRPRLALVERDGQT